MKNKQIHYKLEITLGVSYLDGYDSEARGDLGDLETEIRQMIVEKVSTYNKVNKQIKYRENIELNVRME